MIVVTEAEVQAKLLDLLERLTGEKCILILRGDKPPAKVILAGTVDAYIDPATGQPHIHSHDVSESEVEDVLARAMEDRLGRDDSRIAVGQTAAGRYLRVVYVPDSEPSSVFVITAYEIGSKALKALRRRRRKRP